MGTIKNSESAPTEHKLSDAEFNYVMNIHQAKQNIMQEYDRVTSAFLYYLASNNFGYTPKDELQFELDFTDDSHTLKITKPAKS